MTTNHMLIGLVIAFIAGTVVTGTVAYAAPTEGGNPFDAIQQQIDAINQQLSSIGDGFVTLLQFNQEVSNRQAADSTLQSNIDAEAAARVAADSTLQSNIDAEIAARQAADSTLQSNIDAEAAARALGDTFLQQNINAETAARQAADSTLQSNIDAEAAARVVGDTFLQQNINAETAARQAADSVLQMRINGVCPAGSSIRQVNADGSVLCESDDVGVAGSLSIYTKTDGSTCPAGFPGVCSATVTCNDNDVALSGGYFIVNNALERQLRVGKDFPLGLPQPIGWAIEYVNEHTTTDLTMRVYAVCNSIP